MGEIVTTATGWIVNQGALDTYDAAYKIHGVRDKAMADLEDQAAREDQERATATDWNRYRKCSQVCGVEIGEPCRSLSGRIINGRPDGVRTELAYPHKTRKLRTAGRRVT